MRLGFGPSGQKFHALNHLDHAFLALTVLEATGGNTYVDALRMFKQRQGGVGFLSFLIYRQLNGQLQSPDNEN